MKDATKETNAKEWMTDQMRIDSLGTWLVDTCIAFHHEWCTHISVGRGTSFFDCGLPRCSAVRRTLESCGYPVERDAAYFTHERAIEIGRVEYE